MTTSINSSDKLILALDGMTREEVFALVRRLPKLCWVKVGLELFVREGPEIVAALRDKGLKVFLDLKFHDIPATMAKACQQAAKTGANLITLHACAGSQALLQAKEFADQGALEVGLPCPTLLGVTILTSWDSKRLNEQLLITQPVEERVKWLASISAQSGMGGCVCSPLEVSVLRDNHPEPFELITPGIRLSKDDLDDQSRVLDPRAAIVAGASRLVIGRPITKAIDPTNVFNDICTKIGSV